MWRYRGYDISTARLTDRRLAGILILRYLLKDTEKLCQVTIQLSEAQGNDVMTKYAYDFNNRAVSDKQALISSIMMSQRDKSELVRRRNAQEQTQGQLSSEASAWPEQAQPPLWEKKGRWLGLGRLTGFQAPATGLDIAE